MKVKVRGIYSTALIKLMLDGGFEVTQAADAIKNALKITEESEPDVTVEDIESKEGVYLYGNDVLKLVEYLKQKLPNSVFYREDIGKIYCGIINNTDQKSKSIIISLGNGEEGVLDLRNFWGYVKPGSKILVQSKGTYDGKTMLSTQIRIFGDNLIIIKNGFTKMSKGIRSHEGRDKLYEIAKGLNLKDWGILWIQGAENKDEAVLKEELAKLIEQEKDINDKFNSANDSAVLYEGVNKIFITFSKDDKSKLDDIRNAVMPTIEGHHSLKSAGYTILTDLSESILDKVSDKDLLQKINETLLRYGPIKNKPYRLIFSRLNGTSYRVDGSVEEVILEGSKVKGITVTTRGDWGKTYVIDCEKNFISIKKENGSESMLTFKPEIFPKFSKIVTFDIAVKKEGDSVTTANEDRVERMAKKGEITDAMVKNLGEALTEMKKV